MSQICLIDHSDADTYQEVDKSQQDSDEEGQGEMEEWRHEATSVKESSFGENMKVKKMMEIDKRTERKMMNK